MHLCTHMRMRTHTYTTTPFPTTDVAKSAPEGYTTQVMAGRNTYDIYVHRWAAPGLIHMKV